MKQYPPKKMSSATIETPLGSMIALADDDALYHLAFMDEMHANISLFHVTPGTNALIRSIQDELAQYFAGTLKVFTTPLSFIGTEFQQTTWRALQQIPHGETRSYAKLACMIEKPTAFRAVANANGANPISIVVPCHRVINSNGKLGGYAGGISRKEWLLRHERDVAGNSVLS
jgi:AraC family transcriptional regulator of adaptative response/methylated-DNA-[protein]-cysteine methyltransferase